MQSTLVFAKLLVPSVVCTSEPAVRNSWILARAITLKSTMAILYRMWPEGPGSVGQSRQADSLITMPFEAREAAALARCGLYIGESVPHRTYTGPTLRLPQLLPDCCLLACLSSAVHVLHLFALHMKLGGERDVLAMCVTHTLVHSPHGQGSMGLVGKRAYDRMDTACVTQYKA